MRGLAIAVLLAMAAAGAVAPAPARADIYSQVLRTYQAQGSIPACQFTSAQLSAALRGVDTYGAQYFADFTDAIQAALAARASGSCLQGTGHAHPTAALPPLRPGSLTASTSADVPAPILALAVIGILIALALGLRALARVFGWEPGWTSRWRHACAEASYRLGGGVEAFSDWWRSGR